MKTDAPVLIVGGGPVGLAASLLLAHQGVASLLVERHENVTRHPKASAFNTRTMEILRSLGVAETIYANTGPIGGVSFYTSLRGYKLGEVRIEDHPDYLRTLLASTPTPLTISSQLFLEQALKERAESSDLISVRFNTEHLSARQSAEGVVSRVLDRATGAQTEIASRYLIACDGAGSGIRKACRRQLVGSPAMGHQINVYFEGDIESLVDEQAHQALYWVANKDTNGVFIGLGGDWKKWCYNFSYFPEAGERPEHFDEAACRARIHAALGTTDLDVRILSIGPWVLCGQVIDRYRDGRILFGGDAAHLNIPTGGFGFNTGMQEIHNLAWKLAYVLDGRAPDRLLDSYHEERRPVAVFNVEMSRRNAENIRATGAGVGRTVGDIDAIEEDSAEGARQRAARSTAIARQTSHFLFLGQEIGFGYWDSPLVTPDGSPHYADSVDDPVYQYVPNARPGARAPHCWVERDGERLSLLDLFTARFTLLTSGYPDDWSRPTSPHVDVFSVGQGAVDLVDVEGAWGDFYGIEDVGAVLVRPDGHVAWRGPGVTEAAEIDAAVRRSLAEPAT